jgi:hypothetical protein
MSNEGIPDVPKSHASIEVPSWIVALIAVVLTLTTVLGVAYKILSSDLASQTAYAEQLHKNSVIRANEIYARKTDMVIIETRLRAVEKQINSLELTIKEEFRATRAGIEKLRQDKTLPRRR